MEFFDKLGKKASEAYKVTADKTGKIAREAKLKMKMNDLKAKINEIYKSMGEKIYQKHIREEEYDISKELEKQCTQIDVLSGEIESILKECLELKDKKQCINCYNQIEKNVKFCPECGVKQEEDTVVDVEIVKENEDYSENDDNKEEIKEKDNNMEENVSNAESLCSSAENLERTTEIEINPQLKDDKTIENIEFEEENKYEDE